MSTLKIEKREGKGKYVSFNMRKEGYIPAVIYGKGMENENVKVPLREFDHMLNSGERIIDLDLDGAIRMAVIKDVQHGTFGNEILHADFRVILETDSVEVTIAIELTGQAHGKEEGGMIEQALYDIQVRCLPKVLPEKIELDTSAMGIGTILHVSDLPAIDGLEYLNDSDVAVVSCHLPRGETVDEASEGEEGEGAEATEPEVIGEKEAADE